MVEYPLRVSAATFHEWLNEFSNRVRKKLYKKLDYNKWRSMYIWSEPGADWEEIEINAFDCPELVYIVPRHTDKLSPDGVEIMLHENSFGDYLIGVMEDYNNTTLNISALSGTLSTGADATYATYEYDTCTRSNMECWQPWTIYLNEDELRIATGASLEEYTEKTVNKSNNNKKEEENNKMMKFDFGPVDSSVHMSLYGMAIKNASGTYVAYDAKTGSIMDVDIINFEGANKFMYKMPVALSDVQVGDVIVHSKHPMFVSDVDIETNRMVAVDIYDGEEKVIVPTQSPFGFSFITKVVSLFNFTGNVDASNPFGNMLPFLLMSDSKSTDKDNLLPLMLMAGGNMDMSNPMMMYALMGNRTNDPMMLMLAMGAFNKPTHSCACGVKCGHTETK